MTNPATSTGATEALNLKRLFILRSIAVLFELLAIALAVNLLGMALPLLPLLSIVAFHALINVVTWFRLKRQRMVSAPEFSLQLALDTVVFAMLLYYAGGYTNPFVSLFILPLVITASILPQRFTWFMAALTIACYTVLMFYYIPLPHMHMSHHGGSDFDMHVLGMWFSFLLSAGLVVFFVVRMANSLRERDKTLAEIREKALRDEHLVELGTLATGAAHELGTPLATMAVLTKELCNEYADDPDIKEQAEILREQVDRCKAILSNISASAGQARSEGGGRLSIDQYLNEMIAQWQALRPEAQPHYLFNGHQPPPQVMADKTLTQALINILNNAADASIEHIEVEGHWTNDLLTLDIRDRGEGIPEAVQQAAGTPFFTTKSEGHGLGLYLAKSVVDRYGGGLEISNREDGGTQVRITLPLTSLEVSS